MAMLATTVAKVKGQEVAVVMAVVVEQMVVVIDPEGKEMITEGADIHEVIEEEVKQTEEEVGEKEVEMKGGKGGGKVRRIMKWKCKGEMQGGKGSGNNNGKKCGNKRWIGKWKGKRRGKTDVWTHGRISGHHAVNFINKCLFFIIALDYIRFL